MIGNVFGRLKIIGETCPYVSPKGVKLRKYKVLCNCGKTLEVLLSSLKSGHTRSCGCYREEVNKATKNVKHGCSKGTPEYSVWKAMKHRCLNSNNKNYHHYGGRGITICDRWLEANGQGFINFLEDMGKRPENTSLDRIDVNGGYSKENCHWATQSQQAMNRRTSNSNTSGTKGVFYHKKTNSWDVIWKEEGKRYTKSFSMKKYGETAYGRACDFRKQTISRLNEGGACYAE